ncbi:MAG: universal stress protein [Rhodobacterales bacterium]|nr:universal stress protein [Rhodobacterales bacterium]
MYKNILIPIVFDGAGGHSESLECASALSEAGTNITLLHVIENLPSYVVAYLPEKATDRLRAELRDEMEKLVKKVPGAKGELINGHAGRAIIEYANNHAVDLIVIKSHRPGFHDYFLGSTAAYVVRRAQCAVHVIR